MVRKVFWYIVLFLVLCTLAYFSFRFLGEMFTALLGLVGLGGAGILSNVKRKVREEHEKVAKDGPDAIAADNLERLKRRHNDSW